MLQRLPIGKRLAVAFGSLVLMSAGLMAVAAFGLHVAQVSLDGITGQLIPANAITARAKSALLQSRAAHETMLASIGDAAAVAAAQAEWRQAQQVLDQAMKDYTPFATDDKLKASLKTFADGIGTYRQGVEPVAADLQAGRLADIAQARQRMQAADAGYAPAYELLASIEEKMVEAGAAVFTKVQSAMHTIVAVLGGLCVAAVVAATVLALRITRSVVEPVQQATAFAEQMASGDLSRAPRVQGHDEIARMLAALARMQQALSAVVGQVRGSAENIAVASREVATGNGDLSGRTEQMASNLQQTAASMEQITGTVTQTADAARTAGQLASTASSVAQRGGQVVDQVVATMQEISSASARIADIIGTIDGIAFQTNILALNAAVEAARAGEQGRGFAVVAGEVRQLAQRSAEAAREIKSLIGSSVDKVESGSRLVQDAGTTMGEIVASVKRVTDIVGEIGAATGEQSSGIGQINVAITQLDQVTQQNAALVEESAAAAESLKDQAARLAEVVARFRVAESAAV